MGHPTMQENDTAKLTPTAWHGNENGISGSKKRNSNFCMYFMIMMLLGRIYNYYSGIFTFSPRCLGALLVTISTKTFTLANNSRRFVLKPAYALTS